MQSQDWSPALAPNPEGSSRIHTLNNIKPAWASELHCVAMPLFNTKANFRSISQAKCQKQSNHCLLRSPVHWKLPEVGSACLLATVVGGKGCRGAAICVAPAALAGLGLVQSIDHVVVLSGDVVRLVQGVGAQNGVHVDLREVRDCSAASKDSSKIAALLLPSSAGSCIGAFQKGSLLTQVLRTGCRLDRIKRQIPDCHVKERCS